MSGQAGKINAKLKLALEFGPVLLFFVGFKFFKDKTLLNVPDGVRILDNDRLAALAQR